MKARNRFRPKQRDKSYSQSSYTSAMTLQRRQ